MSDSNDGQPRNGRWWNPQVSGGHVLISASVIGPVMALAFSLYGDFKDVQKEVALNKQYIAVQDLRDAKQDEAASEFRREVLAELRSLNDKMQALIIHIARTTSDNPLDSRPKPKK